MSKKENRREDHKRARAAEKQALRGDHLCEVRAHTWAAKEIQPPIVNDVMPHRSKKQGCKRNKGGKHVIELWNNEPIWDWGHDPETGKLVRLISPWWRRRYHPPYRCAKCHKGFYKIPRGHTLGRGRVTTREPWQIGNPTAEDLADHWSIYNVKMRLLGLKCRCPECNS